jgi:Mn2+/Fe2+ NRAMP family transporter
MPGIIAGAADLDPAAVLTATVAGASFGVSLGWVVVLCVPVLFSVFAVSSRIGQETKKGLVELIREQYGRKWSLLIALLIVAVNLAMIVGDIVAVSDSCSLLTMSPRLFFLAIVGFTVWYVLIIGDYQKTTKVLGGLTLILVSYVLAAYRVSDSFTTLARDVLLPRMQVNSGYMMGVVAVFGSLLTPDGGVTHACGRSLKHDHPRGLRSAWVIWISRDSAVCAGNHRFRHDRIADPGGVIVLQRCGSCGLALRPLDGTLECAPFLCNDFRYRIPGRGD